jgi:hypothetical protein
MKRPLLLMGFFFLFITPIYAAESSIVEAEGNACVKDYNSRKQTEQAALIDAKKRAVEFVSTYIKSEMNVKNFVLEEDILSIYANAEVKTIQELGKTWFKDDTLGDCYKIKIKANIIPSAKTTETKYADYELQERCGMRAEQLFKDQYSMYNDYEFSIARYKSHYNNKLNKCILYIEIIATTGIMSGKKDDLLMDVNENKLLGSGSFAHGIRPMCFINSPEDIKSIDITEWGAFVKRMMRE